MKSQQRKYKTVIEEFSKMGLDVVEGIDKQSVILRERNNLKKWIEGISDGNLSVVSKGSSSMDKTSEIDRTVTFNKEIDKDKEKLKAEVIRLNRVIYDEADKYNGLYMVCKAAMEQNLQFRKQIQRVRNGNAQKGEVMYDICVLTHSCEEERNQGP